MRRRWAARRTRVRSSRPRIFTPASCTTSSTSRSRRRCSRPRKPRDARRSAAWRCWSRRRSGSSSCGPASARRRICSRTPRRRRSRREKIVSLSSRTAMKQTTYEEFAELARRGTFVPVVKEIMADLLTPVSAFLKIAEHSDYAFLFESVEGGERVARYSFLGKDPFLVLRSRDGRTAIERSGVTTETAEPFVPVLRRLMAEFQAPFVPDLPRFTGGAVGFIGYDASIGFEPSLRDAWQKARWASTAAGEDESGFMLFDTVLAFDHVKHRILIVANARVTPDEDLSALYQFACAKITFLERELERGLSQVAPAARPAPEVRTNVTREVFEAG